MPEDTGLLHRRARERVLNDGALVGDIATRVARALHLEGNNRTLGRKIVGLALSELQKAPADAADAARDADDDDDDGDDGEDDDDDATRRDATRGRGRRGGTNFGTRSHIRLRL